MKILQKIFTIGLITAAMLTGFTRISHAQVEEEWVARYNGPGNGSDYASALAVDADGNVYVTGGSYGTGTYGDYATIKYNSSGQEQWVVRYDGPVNGWDNASSLAVDADGNVYVTEGSYGIGTTADYATIKYNSSGQEQWVARYNGPGNEYDFAYSLAVDTDGNVYVTGKSNGIGTSADYATIKYNSSGQEQWVARYNGPGNGSDYAYSLAVDADGSIYVTGESAGTGTDDDYATIKYNSSGQEQWVARYNGPGRSFGFISTGCIRALSALPQSLQSNNSCQLQAASRKLRKSFGLRFGWKQDSRIG